LTDRSQYNFSDTELDPGLLLNSIRVQTNWHVITGAPSCGKTTLINLLADRGFQSTTEGARLYLEREIAKGRAIDDIHANPGISQRGIKDTQVGIERGLRPNDFIFLDRAVPDCLAWYRAFGLDPNEFLTECIQHHYASVFFLDRLPLQLDGLRFKDDAITFFTEEWHLRDYSDLGYDPIRVPVLPPEERLGYILENLGNRGLI
jgi:predicted ATPase